jgi:hypothetical protein
LLTAGVLDAAEPVQDFVKAVAAGDQAAMSAVVRNNEQKMAVTFFVLLEQTSKLLQSDKEEDVRKAQALLVVASSLAVSFTREFPGRNVLYTQFKESSDVLTERVARGWYTEEIALSLVRQVMYENPRRIYGV